MPRVKHPDVAPGLKWCPGCQTAHPVANFSRDRARRDGLNGRCKPCASRKVQASKAKRKAIGFIGRAATAPTRVSPAERAAHDATVADALTGLHAGLAEAGAKPRPKPRLATVRPPSHPYPTAAARKAWYSMCGNR